MDKIDVEYIRLEEGMANARAEVMHRVRETLKGIRAKQYMDTYDCEFLLFEDVERAFAWVKE